MLVASQRLMNPSTRRVPSRRVVIRLCWVWTDILTPPRIQLYPQLRIPKVPVFCYIMDKRYILCRFARDNDSYCRLLGVKCGATGIRNGNNDTFAKLILDTLLLPFLVSRCNMEDNNDSCSIVFVVIVKTCNFQKFELYFIVLYGYKVLKKKKM